MRLRDSAIDRRRLSRQRLSAPVVGACERGPSSSLSASCDDARMIIRERSARPRRVGARGRRAAVASVAALVLVAAAGCTGVHADTGQSASDSAALSAAVDRAAAELVAMPVGPPGVIVTVQRGDEKTVHTAGVANVDTGAAPAPDDHMRIASAAKAFSGATALALVSKGTMTAGRHHRPVAARPAGGVGGRHAPPAAQPHQRAAGLRRVGGLRRRGRRRARQPTGPRGAAGVRRGRAAGLPAGEPVHLLELGQHRRGVDGRPRRGPAVRARCCSPRCSTRSGWPTRRCRPSSSSPSPSMHGYDIDGGRGRRRTRPT